MSIKKWVNVAALVTTMVAGPAMGREQNFFLLYDGPPQRDGTVRGYFGQSFTTPAEGPWDNVRITFISLDEVGATGPSSAYLFDAPFAGAPQDLASSSPLAVDTDEYASRAFGFGSFVMQPNKTYWVYLDTLLGSGYDFEERPESLQGGRGYISYAPDMTFEPDLYPQPDFTQGFDLHIVYISGDEIAVPEPSSWALMISGFGLAGVGLRRRRVMA